jgi:hypothetical protein
MHFLYLASRLQQYLTSIHKEFSYGHFRSTARKMHRVRADGAEGHSLQPNLSHRIGRGFDPVFSRKALIAASR